VRLALALQTEPIQAAQAEATGVWQSLIAQWPILAQALLTVLVTWIVLRLVLNWTGRAMRRARVDTSTQILVRRALGVVIIVLGALFVLGTLGAPPASLVTVLGAVGLAFSLATQDILKNFFSGVYLLLERPFRVGDKIRIKEQEGLVENIGVRTTTLRTLENAQVLVPNALIFAEIVANRSQVREAEAVPAGDGHAVEPRPPGPV
jgi:small-conductance mechanosensitive channel